MSPGKGYRWVTKRERLIGDDEWNDDGRWIATMNPGRIAGEFERKYRRKITAKKPKPRKTYARIAFDAFNGTAVHRCGWNNAARAVISEYKRRNK